MPSITPDINTSLVEQLIKAQFPSWAHLPVSEAIPNDWGNRTLRLDDEMFGCPSTERYSSQIVKEERWLPVLAPHNSARHPEFSGSRASTKYLHTSQSRLSFM